MNAEVLTETVEIPRDAVILQDPHNGYRKYNTDLLDGKSAETYESVPYVFCSKGGEISLIYEVMLP